MTAFLDKDGLPLRMNTHVDNVNLEVTTPESEARARSLAAWDAIKPNLGTMDLRLGAARLVFDPATPITEEKPVAVSNETWLERLDQVKPNLGTMKLPRYVSPYDDKDTPEPAL